MLDPKNGKHYYVQVKKGEIYANQYTCLNGDIFLFSCANDIRNLDSSYTNIRLLDPQELFNFAKSDAAKSILSGNINSWIDFIKSNGITV